MKINNVLLRIRWQRPEDVLASAFLAETDKYVVAPFQKGLSITGADSLGTAVTLFIRPDGQVHLAPASTITELFDLIAKSDGVDVHSDNEISAWVFATGEVSLRGRHGVEEWNITMKDDVLYSDSPDNVLVLTWIRFLSPREVSEVESHMGQ